MDEKRKELDERIRRGEWVTGVEVAESLCEDTPNFTAHRVGSTIFFTAKEQIEEDGDH